MITKGLLEKPFIFECDLKDFFNQVELHNLDLVLQEARVPGTVREYLFKLNMSTPTLPRQLLTDESPTHLKNKRKQENKRKDELKREFYKSHKLEHMLT